MVSGDATISKTAQSGAEFVYTIAGGTSGTTSVFQNTVTTSGGQTLTRTFSLYVLTGANSYQPTTTTKRKVVEQAYSECALNSWELDITADEKDTALHRLDMVMWSLRGKGIEIGYNFPTSMGNGDLDDAFGCPDQAFEGVATLLALRLAPTMGKKMSPESTVARMDAMKAVRSAASGYVPSVSLTPGTPIGSGNKPWSTRYPYSMTR